MTNENYTSLKNVYSHCLPQWIFRQLTAAPMATDNLTRVYCVCLTLCQALKVIDK